MPKKTKTRQVLIRDEVEYDPVLSKAPTPIQMCSIAKIVARSDKLLDARVIFWDADKPITFGELLDATLEEYHKTTNERNSNER